MAISRTDCEGFHRRDFLRVGAAGLLGLSLPDVLRAEARAPPPSPDAGEKRKRKADSVILVWLAGGPATIDMWDLKPDAPEDIRGEFRPIAHEGRRACRSASTCRRLAEVMDRCALVRSLGHTITAHGPGTVYMTTGNRPRRPWSTRAGLAGGAGCCRRRQGVPPYVTLRPRCGAAPGVGPGYLGPAYGPFEVEGGAAAAGRAAPARAWRLPDGFTLDELDSRERCATGSTPGSRPWTRRTCGRPRPLPPAGAGDPALRQDQEGLRPGGRRRTRCARATAGRRSARASWRPGGWSRPGRGS